MLNVMLILVASLKLQRKRDSELLIYAHTIANSLDGNTNFPGVQPKVAGLVAQADRYETALDNVKHGPAGSAAIKNEERQILSNLLREICNDCIVEANGDATRFQTSGFSLRSTPVKHPVLPAPEEFAVFTETVPGRVTVRFKKVAGALTYELWAAPVGEAMQKITTLTNSRGSLINNLQSGTMWQFKLRGLGVQNVLGAFSETVEVPVL